MQILFPSFSWHVACSWQVAQTPRSKSEITLQKQEVRGENCLVKGHVLQKTNIWIPKQNRSSQISSLRLSIVIRCPQHIMQIPLPINPLCRLSSHQLLQRHGPRFQLHGTFPAEGADPVHYLFSSLSLVAMLLSPGMPTPSYLPIWSSLLFPGSSQNASFFLKSPPLLKKAVHIF